MRDARDDDFLDWMRARGVTRDDARCAVRGDGDRGRFVECARATLAVGTTLATIPKSACLTTAPSALGATCQTRTTSTTLCQWRKSTTTL